MLMRTRWLFIVNKKMTNYYGTLMKTKNIGIMLELIAILEMGANICKNSLLIRSSMVQLVDKAPRHSWMESNTNYTNSNQVSKENM